MRSFNLKGEWLVPHAPNEEPAPGRTIYPEPMRMAGPGWKGTKSAEGETVVRREGDVTDEEERAAREWLAHVEAGRIG